MLHQEGMFRTHDGLELYKQCWLPETPPTARLVVVHGLGEHSGRYLGLAAWFVPLGYGVYAFDHRGHGRSPGARGHINRWAEFREDLRCFLADVAEHASSVPLFLLGHSMGALVVLDYALHYQEGLSGVIASGPPLGRGENVSPILFSIGKLLSVIAPKLSMPNGLDAAWLSHNPEVVQAYRDDPLVHGLATPRFAAELDRMMKTTLAAAKSWPVALPLLVVHGGEDPVCPPAASQQFFENAEATDKQRHEYAGFLHESFNEVAREKPLADVQQWLAEHLTHPG